jgi:hypothetical protein
VNLAREHDGIAHVRHIGGMPHLLMTASKWDTSNLPCRFADLRIEAAQPCESLVGGYYDLIHRRATSPNPRGHLLRAPVSGGRSAGNNEP